MKELLQEKRRQLNVIASKYFMIVVYIVKSYFTSPLPLSWRRGKMQTPGF